MTNRMLKVLLIVFIIASVFFFVFNYYLPSKIGAAGPDAGERVNARVESISTTLEKPEDDSIASGLGVSRPKTVTYSTFDPNRIKKQKQKIRKIFTVPGELRTEVNFWRDIYTKYDKTKVIFHDSDDLGVIHSVIDISDIEDSTRVSDEEKRRLKKERVEAEEKRLSKMLGRKARGRIRSQTGIADKFMNGIKISGKYLGEIEEIFSNYNIPLEITRLVFVESMFNIEALSKVGASGIWQFMPGTGRLFVTIDQIVDERNDPILATDAAARHLIRDYEILGSWPLAINSYNSGRGRIERASARLRTKDIAKIIKNYDGSGYGFASRNFYPAFLAALDVFENRSKYFDDIEIIEPLTFDVIETPFFSTLPELSEYTGVPLGVLVVLNRHLKNDVIAGRLPVPIGFHLKVPKGRGNDFLVAMKEMDEQTKYAKWHIVEPNENLKTIAAKYKTNASKLKQLNRLHRNRVKPGTILNLPKGIALAKE